MGVFRKKMDREGKVTVFPLSVRPLTSNNLKSFGGKGGVKNISMLTSPKKHHYIIKAGDSRATRTLVLASFLFLT